MPLRTKPSLIALNRPIHSMVSTAEGMLRENTPVEYYEEFNLYVKREDLSCPPPGPPFSKARGVYAWVKKQEADLIGVLDTRHSQAGHAVARACQILGKKCVNFYPDYKADPGPRLPQFSAKKLGAELVPLSAGRSCILYHAARKATEKMGGVIIPNALKLDESVSETARECNVGRARLQGFDTVIIPISSGTIAAGVMRGMGSSLNYVIHLGYSRSEGEVRVYLREKSGLNVDIQIVNEKYQYKDEAREGVTPPWPCNPFYDLKAFRWFLNNAQEFKGEKVLLWNIG